MRLKVKFNKSYMSIRWYMNDMISYKEWTFSLKHGLIYWGNRPF